MPNPFFWYELMTSDPEAARKFYSDVVGWTAKDSGVPGYTIFNVQDQGVAGLMQILEEVVAQGGRPAWMGYILVDNADAMAERIKQEGGTVHHGPFDVPGVIRIAPVSDPQGVAFMIGQPLTDGPQPLNDGTANGTVGWHELYANEWESDFAFYEKLFGWTKAETHDMGPMGIYQLFAAGGRPIGGMMTKPPQVPVPHWGFYFNVEAIDTATDRLKAAGGTVRNGPMQVPGGQWIVQAMDPQGAAFSLVASKR
jgi:uncharacterized protein